MTKSQDAKGDECPCTQVGFIKRFIFDKTDVDANGGFFVEIILASSLDELAGQVTIRGRGVLNLKIGDLNAQVMSQLSISDICSHGLEGIRWRISDTENQCVSFDCRIIEVHRADARK